MDYYLEKPDTIIGHFYDDNLDGRTDALDECLKN